MVNSQAIEIDIFKKFKKIDIKLKKWILFLFNPFIFHITYRINKQTKNPSLGKKKLSLAPTHLYGLFFQ